MSEPERLPIDRLVSEEDAHRVLARAVELDARLAAQVSIARLREVAHEAGIAPAAFEAALSEFRVEHARADGEAKPGFLRSLRDRNRRSTWQSLTSNVAAFVAFAVLIVAIGRTNRALDWNWQTYHAMQILATAIVATFSVRRRARISALFFGTTTAAQAARYVMHLLFGIQTVQGGPTQWGLILASLLGIGFGALLLRSRQSADHAPPRAGDDTLGATVPGDVAAERRPPASLILRTT
jgi:hypothetical protein